MLMESTLGHHHREEDGLSWALGTHWEERQEDDICLGLQMVCLVLLYP